MFSLQRYIRLIHKNFTDFRKTQFPDLIQILLRYFSTTVASHFSSESESILCGMALTHMILYMQVYKLLASLDRVRWKDLPDCRTPCVGVTRHAVFPFPVILRTVFQALKFIPTNPDLAEQIRTQPSARAARTEAGFYRAQQRPDWFEVNIEVMDVVLHAKFTQHDDLRQKLLGTVCRELIEDSPVGVKYLSTAILVY